MASDEEPMVDGRPISDLKVVDLRKELEIRGLDKKGNKKDLYERLREHLLQQESTEDVETSPKKSEENSSEPVNPLVAQYLATQEKALKAAQRDAEIIRAKTSDSEEGSPTRRRSSRLGSESSVKSKDDAGKEKPETIIEENETVEKMTVEENVSGRDKHVKDATHTDTAPEEPTKTEVSFQEKMGNDNVPENLEPKENVKATEEDAFQTLKEEVHDAKGDEANDENMEADTSEEAIIAKSPQTKEPEASTENEVTETVDEESNLLTSEPIVEKDDEAENTVNEVPIEETDLTEESNKDDKSSEPQEMNPAGLGTMSGEVEEPTRPQKTEKSADDELDYEEDDVAKEDVQAGETVESTNKIEEVTSTTMVIVKQGKTEVREIPASRLIMNAVKESKNATSEKNENLTEDGLFRLRPVSPARYPVTSLIYIRGLKRPFTPRSLKQLLSTFGTLVEELWLDDIKSQCIAKFETNEMASLARERLHHVKWPDFNEEGISVDFTTDEHLRKKRTTDEDELEEMKLTVTVENKEVALDNGTKKDRDTEPVERRKYERERERSSRRHTEREEVDKKEVESKTLETLFRKTKTQPAIYYLPLTEEEAKERAERKKADDRERKRAIESRGSPGVERKRRRESPYQRHRR